MIEMVGLTKQFETVLAVDGIHLAVQPGEVLALLGPNGAGKTTTVRMLSAILKPTAGHALVAGYDVATQSLEVRRRVGMLTESPGLYQRMSGQEYLDFFGEVRGLAPAARRARIAHLAEWFEMSGVLERRLGEYSKGMAQKVALMRTLLHDPVVLLLDEPTSAMDPQSARLVRNAILQLRGSQRTIIICTHNLVEAEELADRIAIIRQGRIVEQGTPAELKARLLGAPVMEVRFAQPGLNGATALVARFAQIERVGEDSIRYRSDCPGEVNSAILAALLAAGMPVFSLSEVPQSLETVYLRVVADKQSSAEGMVTAQA
ncbi:MAG: Daunorubicin/doxorubicin resistance ATP-binding protein DrrA [Chloroflexi bacterium ADurb.Bin360]|nr:MAG: Daunorubicin/doxorubicin resistance ATP-binding protein DrrA [Chloroflexi bacterium ADurb.Bin360]